MQTFNGIDSQILESFSKLVRAQIEKNARLESGEEFTNFKDKKNITIGLIDGSLSETGLQRCKLFLTMF